MAEVSDYLALVTSEHADKPKFIATLEAVLQPIQGAASTAANLYSAFDLDRAVGAQLDIVGLWVGIGRGVKTPLAGVYFALDTDAVGFDQGVWKGQYDPDSGVVSLDDETYRVLIRAKIGANHWDGTLAGSKAILDLVFSGDTDVFIEDNQDMTMTVGVSGTRPSALFLALLTGGYFPSKPEGVGVDYYIVSSDDGPLFGFDINNQYIAGFDQGSWGTIYQQ
ncbi:MAG: hypothetical protein GAK36_00206 [Pseudomonas sp.]|nr:MAG: hypothetical protein GAK36_00206 [Pseudomonas sp.]